MSLDLDLNKILIIDFGSQFTQLIARRVRELGVFSEIISHKKIKSKNINNSIKGIILSGGPLNVYDLKKYYPKTWAKFDQITKKKGYDLISNNLKRGVELGVYRKEIHVEILAKILTEKFEIIFNQAVFSSPSISFATIYQELMSHYIYGIVNESGKEYFKKNKEKFMSNETN